MTARVKPLLALILTISLSSCGSDVIPEELAYNSFSKTNEVVDTATNPEADYTYEEDVEADSLTNEQISESANRKIERFYEYSFETTDFDADKAKLDELVAEFDGYTASANLNINKDDSSNQKRRYLYTSIKIPVEKSEKFRTEVEKIGELRSISSFSEDLTKSYTDTNIRLASKQKELDKLNDLIENANDLEDVMAIQARILEVEADIDQIKASLKDIESRTSYNSYNIDLIEVYSYNTYADKNPDFTSRLKTAFGNSIHIFINFIQSLIIGLVSLWPLIIILVAIGSYLVKRAKKNKLKKEQKIDKTTIKK